MRLQFLLSSSILAIIFLWSCNEPTIVGAGLLTNEGIDIQYVDTFSIQAKTVKQDSIITNSNNLKLTTLLCGEVDDLIFGKSTMEAYLDIHLSGTIPQFTYEDELGEEQLVSLDSLVLVFAYDTLGFYGYPNAQHDLEVYLMNESIPEDDSIYSNQIFDSQFMPVGGLSDFTIQSMDTLTIVEAGDTFDVAGQLRIPMSDDFGNMIIMDTASIMNDTLFTAAYPGLKVTSIPNVASAMGWDMFFSSSVQYNSLILYYSDDEESNAYHFRIAGDWHVNIEHDYTGTIIEEALADPTYGDSLLFLQAMSGLDIELDFPSLSEENIGEVIINRAELEFYVAELPGDDLEVFKPAGQLITSTFDENGDKFLTQDAILSLNTGIVSSMLGGIPFKEEVSGIEVTKYKLNVTGHVIKTLKEEGYDSSLLLSRYLKQERPDRAVIYGPGHSVYPMKLNIIYSLSN
jgi:hypothetical protein